MNELDPKLLEILACPACDDRPHVVMRDNCLHCPRCGRSYPIRDGIPVMLIDEAVKEE